MSRPKLFRTTVALATTALLASACTTTNEDANPTDIPVAPVVETTSATAETEAAETAPGTEAAVEWKETLIDGPTKPEDLIEAQSGDIFISGMSADPTGGTGAGSVYLMDAGTGKLTTAWPNPNLTRAEGEDIIGGCEAAPDDDKASPHGLGIEVDDNGRELLYVVNHGGRESVEIFEVTGETDAPLNWLGCAVLPEGGFGNGVVPDPSSDGFYVTDFFDPTDMVAEFQKAFDGEPTGAILHWSTDTGWRTVPGSELSTPNGVAVSDDGKSLYVASWGGWEIVELDAENGGVVNRVNLDIMPDNFRPTDDGKFLITGQYLDDFDTFLKYESGELEPEDRYDVFLFDPEAFTVEPFAVGSVEGFGNPTTALDLGDRVLVGSVGGDKILELSRP
jgi:hypothetical protein